MTPLLSARKLRRRLGGRVLWQDLDLDLDGGESLAVVGASGSGKSLLLRALAGLDPLEGGEVTLEGRAQAAWPMPQYRAHVMYLPQRPALYPGTVLDNLRRPFALTAHRARTFDRQAACAALAALGRGETFLPLEAASLSGGEGQLVALARALLLGPRVLLLDEATAALDPDATHLAEQALLNWLSASSGRALVWVSHDAAQRGRVASRALPLPRREPSP